jgi:hypothetical protein
MRVSVPLYAALELSLLSRFELVSSTSVTGVAVFHDNGSDLLVNFVSPDRVEPEIRKNVKEAIEAYVSHGTEVIREGAVALSHAVDVHGRRTSAIEVKIGEPVAIVGPSKASSVIIRSEKIKADNEHTEPILRDTQSASGRSSSPIHAKPVDDFSLIGSSTILSEVAENAIESDNQLKMQPIKTDVGLDSGHIPSVYAAEEIFAAQVTEDSASSTPGSRTVTEEAVSSIALDTEIVIIPTESIPAQTVPEAIGERTTPSPAKSNLTHHVAAMRSKGLNTGSPTESGRQESNVSANASAPNATTYRAIDSAVTTASANRLKGQDTNDRSQKGGVPLASTSWLVTVAIVVLSVWGR